MALKLGIPVFMVEAEDEEGHFDGDNLLKTRGARCITCTLDSNPDLNELIAAISREPNPDTQISLFGKSDDSPADLAN